MMIRIPLVLLACSAFATGYAQTKEWDAKVFGLSKKSCDEGDGSACRGVAEYYTTGTRAPKDPAKATEFYKRFVTLSTAACEKGSALACSELSLAYERGEGVPVEPARAAAFRKQASAFFQQGCDKGSMTDCVGIGTAYKHGDGVPKDVARGVALLKKACAAGLKGACAEAKSLKELQEGCDHGGADDCFSVGVAYQYGEDAPKDLARAAALYKKACDGGDLGACEQAKTLKVP